MVFVWSYAICMMDFDRPLFKLLAPNDTAAAVGHQGGILIPSAMDRYFPQLGATISPAHPAAYEPIRAALFIGSLQVGLVSTRYQYQTWGGTRAPERRITGNLGPLRQHAGKDDLFLIERSLSEPDFYRLTLHRVGTPLYNVLIPRTGGRRWGPLDLRDTPVSETAIAEQLVAQEARETGPFELFDGDAVLVETRSTSLARSKAFSKRLLPMYQHRCAVCGRAHRSQHGHFETEAAHIVPRGLKGAADARNGLALCRSHHWAFDKGLFGILPSRHVVVHPLAGAEPDNAHLLAFNGVAVQNPSLLALQPAAEALAWHLQEIVKI